MKSLCTIWLALILATICRADTLTGRVVSIADGDTITVLDANRTQHKIRFNGIDSPEKAQPFGQAAKKHLSGLIFGKEVSVEWSKRDRYGRIVGIITCAGEDIGLAMIRAGFAWYFRRYERELPAGMQREYDQAEGNARAGKRGLWADESPVAPWTWREQKKIRSNPV